MHPLAGQRAPHEILVDLPKLLTAYYTHEPSEPVAFGTSGHRGSSLNGSFNELHILAMAQAIAELRKPACSGPLFLGKDTHALSQPAEASAIEVLVANGVEVVIAAGDAYTPTPVISHAILAHNRGRSEHLGDGVVITPSHNPPEDGGRVAHQEDRSARERADGEAGADQAAAVCEGAREGRGAQLRERVRR